jgi:hypothetical protein
VNKVEQLKLKAKEKAKAKKAKKDDDNDDDEEEDVYTALSKSMYQPTRPSVGSFENCAKCKKQFTMVSRRVLLVSCVLKVIADEVYYRCCPTSWFSVSSMRQIVWF